MSANPSIAMSVDAGQPRVTLIQPAHGWTLPVFSELWRHRDLLWLMALRDIQVRYKQTALGALWAVIQPLITMVVFSVIFGRLMGMADRTDGPYPVFLYAGLLPWTFFAATVQAASMSLVTNANMLRKIYFPRLIMPVAAAGAPLLDYAIASFVLLGLMLFFSVTISAKLLLLPLMLLSVIIAALGVGILLAALTVTYRDFRYVVQFLVQVWFFLTPVLMPVSIVPPSMRLWLHLNPMSGPIVAMRAVVLDQPIDLVGLAVSTTVGLVILAAALFAFGRTERSFADVV